MDPSDYMDRIMNIGHIYIRLESGLFKLVNITEGSDRSIYISMPATTFLTNEAITDIKFTYHPDGNNWMTYFLRTDMSKKQRMKYDQGPALTDIKSITQTKLGMSYQNIQQINSVNQVLDQATSEKKISAAKIIDARNYNHLTIRFLIMPSGDETILRSQFPLLERLTFNLSGSLKLVAQLENKWAGDNAP